MKKNSKIVVKVLYFTAAGCFIISIALIVLLRLLELDSISQWYAKYTDTLMKFEQSVENLDDLWLAALFIEMNFIIKSFIPWFPVSVMCFATGVIFKWYFALPINILGLVIQFTVKYYWGKWRGGGNGEKLLSKNPSLYNFVGNTNKITSPIALFVLRLIPAFPVNSISQIYGARNFEYKKYLLISLFGFSYKLFSYTLIGRNVYDPLSAKFILPLVPLFFMSGIAILIISGGITVTVTARNRIKLSKAKK